MNIELFSIYKQLKISDMKIYTKGGDKGTTSLVGGKRVAKNHPRVEAYGDVDELISFIGLVISDAPQGHERDVLEKIQKELMLVSAHFASDSSAKKMKELSEDDVTFLEKEIDRMTDEIPTQTAFVLPGAPRVSSECHVARTICRRAERHSLAIFPSEKGETEPENIDSVERGIKYLNRLSDYLFTLGRYYCHKCGGKEIFWLP